ncbi:MAG: tetratricopeptide repeat protein [Saprospiraceae bacterium]
METKRLNQLLAFHTSNPKDEFILFALAKEYEKHGDEKKALLHYLELVDHSPNYVGTYYHLGKLYEKMQELSHAFSTYKKGMEVARNHNDQHALSELAAAKLELGDDEDFD